MSNKIAILAHPEYTESMIGWIKKHQTTLAHFGILMTEDLYEDLILDNQIQQLSVTLIDSLSKGGDLVLALEIAAREIACVFFFVDPQVLWLNYPSFHLVLRNCQNYNIPLILNRASAELIIRGFSQSRIAYLIFNPVAGRGNPEQDLSLIRSILEPQVLVQVIYTQEDLDPIKQAEDAVATLKSQGENGNLARGLIIASGGDGTVSAVASAVIGTNIPLGVIPRGTANAFATALGIPNNLRGACEIILASNTRVIDAAICNSKPMILLAGLGFEAEMVNKANRELKNRLGTLAYLLAGARQVTEQQSFKAILEINKHSTEIEATAITIANVAPITSVLAQGFGEVICDDGLLEITIATVKTALDGFNAIASLFTSALVKKPTNHDNLLCLRSKSIKITLEEPQKLVIDGEIIETSIVKCECQPGGLRVYAPFDHKNSDK